MLRTRLQAGLGEAAAEVAAVGVTRVDLEQTTTGGSHTLAHHHRSRRTNGEPSRGPRRRCAVPNGPSQRIITSRQHSQRSIPHRRRAVASGPDRRVTPNW